MGKPLATILYMLEENPNLSIRDIHVPKRKRVRPYISDLAPCDPEFYTLVAEAEDRVETPEVQAKIKAAIKAVMKKKP